MTIFFLDKHSLADRRGSANRQKEWSLIIFLEDAQPLTLVPTP